MLESNVNIGDKIKTLRTEKGMSISELAQQAEIPEATLTKIEEENFSPPLGNIVNLAKVFDVAVGDFFGESGDSPFCIVRSEDRTEVPRFSAAYSKSCGYNYKGLGQQKRNRQMEPFLVTLNPIEGEEPESNQHIGEEFIFVLEGQVKISLLNHQDILHPGDSVYYDSNVPHIISCHGNQPATILAVIYAKEEMIIL
jgi:transcriptional regulator with XRE-family HTH domain